VRLHVTLQDAATGAWECGPASAAGDSEGCAICMDAGVEVQPNSTACAVEPSWESLCVVSKIVWAPALRCAWSAASAQHAHNLWACCWQQLHMVLGTPHKILATAACSFCWDAQESQAAGGADP
jgi:hypothetical protein